MRENFSHKDVKLPCVKDGGLASRVHQDGLHDLAGMHGPESGLPVLELPESAHHRTEVELVGGQQAEDALPDRPVVAEAALQGDVFLHERIKIEPQRLRTPTDF